MATTTTGVCAKCGGNGEYHFRSGAVEACYPCNGIGRVDLEDLGAVRILSTSEIVARIQGSPDRMASTLASLRNLYRNARDGFVSFDDFAESFPNPATNPVLALFPDAVRAFRGLGWPV